jgi:hypothetical protein
MASRSHLFATEDAMKLIGILAAIAAAIALGTQARATTPAMITVDCASNLGPVNPFTWGVVGPGSELPWLDNPDITRRLRDAGFKIVRVFPIQKGRLDHQDVYPKPGVWNFAEIDHVLKPIFDAGAQPIFLVCGIPEGVPHAMDADRKIVSADWDEYARFMAGVVRRYNVEHALGKGRTITYWELWNEPTIEPDGKFASQEDYAAFARTVGDAMKRVDPSIKLVAPVDAWADLGARGYMAFSAKNLEVETDILCWHNYGPGPDRGTTDAGRMAWTVQSYQRDPTTVRSGGPGGRFTGPSGKRYGAAITEYNFSGMGFGPAFDPKYHDEHTAVYAASAVINAMKGGLDLFCFFTLVQAGANHLGLLDNRTYAPYKPYYTFQLFGKHFGNRKLALTGETDTLEAVAAKNAAGRPCVVIVNKDLKETYRVTVGLEGLGKSVSGVVRVWRVDRDSRPMSYATLRFHDGRFTYPMPPLTVAAFEVVVKP